MNISWDSVMTAKHLSWGSVIANSNTAESIYQQLFGHLDNKTFGSFHNRKVCEIFEWLVAGDSADYTIEDLTAEWAALDSEVAINRP